MREDDRRKGKEEAPRDGQQKLFKVVAGGQTPLPGLHVIRSCTTSPRLFSPSGRPMSDWSVGVTLDFPKILGDPWIHETHGQAKIELGAENFWPDSSGTSRRSANGAFRRPC
jgi:hypothetical protein